jgi:hypothetical protein
MSSLVESAHDAANEGIGEIHGYDGEVGSAKSTVGDGSRLGDWKTELLIAEV